MYPSKEVVLKAYLDLSSISEDPVQQGATQKVSAIRYLFALDAFLKQTGRQYCDSGLQSDRRRFFECVSDVVNVADGLYTAAFYYPLVDHNGDCNTGSNFFSAGQVKASTINTSIDCPYPKRGGWPSLLSIQNGRVSVFHDDKRTGYSNAKWYLNSAKHQAAFFVWIARNWDVFSTSDSFVAALKAKAEQCYSEEMIETIFPPENEFAPFISGKEVVCEKSPDITEADIKNLFASSISTQKNNESIMPYPLQLISYGAPGTGKSDGIERKLRERKIEAVRTTFHPDSDYQSFVGAYKPFTKTIPRVVYVNDGKTAQLVEGPRELKEEEVIAYEFRPQAFTDAYVKAWRAMSDGGTQPVVLVIEEINRGDCAKIFGDLFQLLDRDDETGFSRYPIVADKDLGEYLRKEFGDIAAARPASDPHLDVYLGRKLVLPPNLYIWATMNTSDQSLFPMDSAFKRRWDWQYVPITEGKDRETGAPLGWRIDADGTTYDWWDFLKVVNRHIFDLTSSEDKQLGYFFVKARDNVISLDVFVNKVVFYLWNAVFKDCYTECDFLKDGDEYLTFTAFFDGDGHAKADAVRKFIDNLHGKGAASKAGEAD